MTLSNEHGRQEPRITDVAVDFLNPRLSFSTVLEFLLVRADVES